jgi:hypothetical protein
VFHISVIALLVDVCRGAPAVARRDHRLLGIRPEADTARIGHCLLESSLHLVGFVLIVIAGTSGGPPL